MLELCNQSELHANLMTQWNKRLLAQAAGAFEGGSKPVKGVDLVPLPAFAALAGHTMRLSIMRAVRTWQTVKMHRPDSPTRVAGRRSV